MSPAPAGRSRSRTRRTNGQQTGTLGGRGRRGSHSRSWPPPAAGRPGGNAASGNISATKGLVTTTPAGTKPVSSVTWAVYRDVNSLDPIFAFDYPENTAVSLMCESLLLQAPDGSLAPWPGHAVEPVTDHSSCSPSSPG